MYILVIIFIFYYSLRLQWRYSSLDWEAGKLVWLDAGTNAPCSLAPSPWLLSFSGLLSELYQGPGARCQGSGLFFSEPVAG